MFTFLSRFIANRSAATVSRRANNIRPGVEALERRELCAADLLIADTTSSTKLPESKLPSDLDSIIMAMLVGDESRQSTRQDDVRWR